MRYDYRCSKCSTDKEWIIFEVEHGMSEEPEILCPKCKHKCEKAFLEQSNISWTRGYGWLDKRGRKRDMNLHKLENNDPYGHMRESGEAEDLAKRLRNGGRFVSLVDKETKKPKPSECKQNITVHRIEYVS